jgi:hypothetical protein
MRLFWHVVLDIINGLTYEKNWHKVPTYRQN